MYTREFIFPMSTSPPLLRKSRVLAALRSGRPATCLKLNLADPRIAEISGIAGVDAVWLCNEHVPNHWLNMEGQIRAAKLYNVDTFVRVEKGSYSDYIRPFEADANGILVPHVTTADEARQIVAWTRFQPVGRRPLDGGNADARFCAVPLEDYLAHSLREQFVILQIESPEALENLEEIAAVPGFDMFCFGPGDYSHLIGKPGQVTAPEVVAARQRVARVAREHGKFVMTSGLMASRQTMEEEGHGLFNLGADVVGLSDYVRQKLKSFHDAPGGAFAGTAAAARA
ncbi:MAG: aldolase [Verrucomicrobia bacterium]|nr:aldolase [Verrucomicrobiota bacterium]